MTIRADEIMSVLKEEIKNFSSELHTVEAGIVIQVGEIGRAHV